MPLDEEGHLICEVCGEIVPSLNVVEGHFALEDEIIALADSLGEDILDTLKPCTLELCDVCLEGAADNGFIVHANDEVPEWPHDYI